MNSTFDRIKQTTSFKIHNEFIKELLSKDNEETYDIHLDLISKSESGILHDRLCRGFSKRTKKAAKFLLEKITSETLPAPLVADAIQILGLMKYDAFLKYADYFLANRDETIRYKCIIVLGWIGAKNEIDTLFKILNSSEEDYLRGFSATAMRQIWFNHPNLGDYIIPKLIERILIEKDDLVLSMIIITLQDLLNKNFGLKESETGEIFGDVRLAKENLQRYITKLSM